ncbi:putative amidoligase enzyme-domain-containing protein [Xylariomycetidae sp. FL0641]|nr:putative amidoligase enzyme-domain-containing protein [Xylariomycetidae sp. FL0641]
MASDLTFQFGVEIELLLGSRTKNHKSWKSLATELSVKLHDAGIPNHLNESNVKSAENYHEWSITQEVTVPMQAGKNLFGLELVSPILTPTSSSYASQLTRIFRVLRAQFVLAASDHCSTHIHLSTLPPLTTPQLIAVAKATLRLEPFLDALLPLRPSSYWCQSNRNSVSLQGLPLHECLELLDACADTPAVVRTMCLFPRTSAYGRAHGATANFVHGGVWKWDFSRLGGWDEGVERNRNASATLEFRQPGQSLCAEDALAAVELGVCFVAGTVDGDGGAGGDDGIGELGGDMQDLAWLLRAGAKVAGMDEVSGLERVFARAGRKGLVGGKEG